MLKYRTVEKMQQFDISHETAVEKANSEYDKYKTKTKDELSQVEKDFLENMKKTQKMLEKLN